MKKRILVLTMAAVLAAGIFAGCGAGDKENKAEGTSEASVQTSSTSEGSDIQITGSESDVQITESGSTEGIEAFEEGSEEIDPEEEALIQKENEIMEENYDLWTKVFDKVDNEESMKKMDEGQTYMEFLEETVEKAKEDLTEDEYKTIQKDVEKIAEIEKQISELGKNSEK